jgi:hypothetical protein
MKQIFKLSTSDLKTKRFMVINLQTNKKIHFGSPLHENYNMHEDDERKFRYIKRHEKNEDWTINGINTAGFWSRWILWNKKGLINSIKDTENRFNINIEL